MKGWLIGYWVITGLLAVWLGWSAVEDLRLAPSVAATLAHLGYPLYMARMLGAFKLLGLAVVLAPCIPRIKEWAYAGIALGLVGSSLSHLSSGDRPDTFMAPLMFLAVVAMSWALRPPSRVLGQLFPWWLLNRHYDGRSRIELLGAEVGQACEPPRIDSPSFGTK
jgi:hypothetical protein